MTSLSQPSGLTLPPVRAFPSRYIPRLSALKFHPLEMLYCVGEPDGTVKIMGCGKL